MFKYSCMGHVTEGWNVHLGKLNLCQVQRAIWQGRAKWYNIGIELGITADTLDVIKRDNHYVTEDCFTTMLKEWLKKQSDSLPASWSELAAALRSPPVGLEHLADQVEGN